MSNLTFAPDASLETEDGQQIALSFFRSKLQGCPGAPRWRGLVINEGEETEDGYSEITFTRSSARGAITGVDMRADALLTLTSSSLRDHQTGIGSVGEDVRNISIITPEFPGAQPAIANCNVGIRLEGVEAPFLQWMRLIDNITGIRVERAKACTVDEVTFSDNHRAIDGHDMVRGVSVTNSKFSGDNRAVELNTYTWFVFRDNEIEDCYLAINLRDNHFNSRAFIEDNLIRSDYNIQAFHRRGWANVRGNTLVADKQNILVWGTFGGGTRWDIHNNPVLFAGLEDDANGNIILVGAQDAALIANPSMIADNGRSTILYGGENNYLFNNNMDATEENIYMESSAINTIQCNTTNGGTGLQILNDCSGADILGNNFIGSNDQGLIYGDAENTLAFTGMQAYKGNRFMESTPQMRVATHFGSISEAQFNLYVVNENNIQGNNIFPYNDAPIDNWFVGVSNFEDFTCNEGIVGEETELDKTISAALNAYLLYPVLLDRYAPDISAATELKGMRYRIKTEDVLSLHSVIDGYLQNPSSPYGQLISEWNAVNQNYADPNFIPQRARELITADLTFDGTINPSDEEREQMAASADALSVAHQNLLETASIISVLPDGSFTFNDDLYQEHLQLKIDNLATQAAYDALLFSKETELQAVTPNLITDNTNADPEGLLPYEVKKYVDGIVFKYSTQENYTLATSELAQLTAYADLCPAEGGESVYLARALLARRQNEVEYNFLDRCAMPLVSSPEALLPETDTEVPPTAPVIYPNPTYGGSTLQLPRTHGYRTLIIKDVSGKTIYISQVDEDTTNLTLDGRRWPSGLYYLSLLGDTAATTLKWNVL